MLLCYCYLVGKGSEKLRKPKTEQKEFILFYVEAPQILWNNCASRKQNKKNLFFFYVEAPQILWKISAS